MLKAQAWAAVRERQKRGGEGWPWGLVAPKVPKTEGLAGQRGRQRGPPGGSPVCSTSASEQRSNLESGRWEILSHRIAGEKRLRVE